MQEWLWKSAAELGRGIGKGEIDPVDLARTYLDAIAAHPMRDRIYARVTADRAMAEAIKAWEAKGLTSYLGIVWLDEYCNRPLDPILFTRLERSLEVFRRAGFAPKVVREVARFSQAVSLVAAGLGVHLTLAPYRVYPHPGVVLRPLEEEAALEVALIYARRPPPPRLEEVRRLLRALAL